MFNIFNRKKAPLDAKARQRAFMVEHADILAQIAYLTKHVNRLEGFVLDQGDRLARLESAVDEHGVQV